MFSCNLHQVLVLDFKGSEFIFIIYLLYLIETCDEDVE